MLISYKLGQASIVLRVKIFDSTVSTGAGKTGLTSASSGLIIGTIADNEATTTAYTQAGSTIEAVTTLGTYAAPTATKCRFKEVDATNHKGVYEIQIADARFAVTSAKSLIISASGVTGMAEGDWIVPLTSVDPYDGVHFGLTGIPNAAAGASGGLLISGSNSGTTTLAALTVTGATTLTGNVAAAAGVTITQSSSNTAGLSITGNGTGAGILSTGGTTGHGISATSGATSGNGINTTGNTLGHGISSTGVGTSKHGLLLTAGGTTANGLNIVGGSTSGAGIAITTTSGDGISSTPTAGHAITLTANGTTKHGINAAGGATTSHGASFTGGGVGHGILSTSGSGATGDGIQAIAASTNGNGMTLTKTGSGKDFNATTTPLTLAKTTNITGFNDIAATAIVSSGAITTSGGAVSTVTSVTNRVTANTDQLAGQTVTAAAGVTFPTSVASPTNITAGTITTATNLTNAPTAGDFTATMKTSLNAATPTVTVSDKTGFSLSSAGNNSVATAVFNNSMTEDYPVPSTAITLAQGMYDMVQQMNEKSISSTTLTIKKRDKSTTAKTFTLNDATNPSSITETT